MKFKTILPYLAVVALSPLAITTLALAQTKFARENTTSVQVTQVSDAPQAVVLSVRGVCERSKDGKTFTKLRVGQVLTQGTVVRTGEDARSDLFFRRIGTTVRVQPGTEMKMEKMTRTVKGDKTVLETLLDLRTGRIFTVVRALIPDSTFEIRNAAGRSMVEGGGGKGRYIITADGTHVTD